MRAAQRRASRDLGESLRTVGGCGVGNLVAFKQASHWGSASVHRAKGECLALERRGLVVGRERGREYSSIGRAGIQGVRERARRSGTTVQNACVRHACERQRQMHLRPRNNSCYCNNNKNRQLHGRNRQVAGVKK